MNFMVRLELELTTMSQSSNIISTMPRVLTQTKFDGVVVMKVVTEKS